MNYMVHVSSTMWRTKKQPSNSTSCSNNALHLLVVVAGRLYRGLQVMSSFSIWGCIVKGCFEIGIFWRAKLHLKGIEDVNLEHWNQPFGWFNFYLGLVHIWSQFLLVAANPNMKAKTQLVNLKWSLECGWISLKSDLDYFMTNYLQDLGCELGLASRLTHLTIQVPSVTSKKCHHVGIHVIVRT